MKIRSYTGRSLDKLYDAVQNELGPQAVVVSTRQTRKKVPLLGGAQYELIAVADDAEADRHLVEMASGQDVFKRWSRRQERRWDHFEETLESLRSELERMGTAQPSGEDQRCYLRNDRPAFAQEWDPRFAEMVEARAPAAFEEDGAEVCREAVAGLLPVAEDFTVKREQRPHVIVLAGPTGAGKTTTIAKLAARWSMEEDLSVGLITTDTYRVAAVDQIREYATLLGLDLQVAFSAGEAARAVEAMRDKDVILVDTPGRSHYDKTQLMALKGILRGMGEVTVMLVAPAATPRQGFGEMMEHFSILGVDYLVMTKVDETRHFDALTTLACEGRYPVAFFADGQRVPQDLHSARLVDAVDLLVPGEG
jgi:flagellar biosynthesis protein FlhF